MEAVVARDGKEYIIEVNDSATALLGESQEEDRKNIAELVLKEMEVNKRFIYNKLLLGFGWGKGRKDASKGDQNWPNSNTSNSQCVRVVSLCPRYAG